MNVYAYVMSIEGSRPVVITMQALRDDLVRPWPPPRQNYETVAINSNREGVVTKATFVMEVDQDETALQVGALVNWTSTSGWQGIVG